MGHLMVTTIQQVQTKKDLERFVEFPYRLYRNNPYWVPPLRFDEMNTLRKDKNPAFEFCEAEYWLAFRGSEIVGRIAGIINHTFEKIWKHKYARFGWIDFVDDAEVASALLEVAEQWARNKGMEAVHGPLGFTDMDREGMLVEGFEEPGTLATIYNYPYYPHYVEMCGYGKDVDWIEFQVTPPQEVPEKVARIAEIALQRYGMRVLRVKHAKDLLPYAQKIFELINASYRSLYGFVPLTQAQIDMYVKQYFGFIKPEYVPIVLDSKDNVAAFGITMPSLTSALQKSKGRLFPFGFLHLLKAMRHNDTVDLYLTAVRPDLQDKGINAILMNEMNILYAQQRIARVETNPELETNTKVQAQWKFYESRQHKRRRCYIKPLTSGKRIFSGGFHDQ